MLPFSPPRIDQKIIDAVVETLNSKWITTGPKTKLFEKKIAEYCNAQSVLCLNSATAGLELVLRWFGITNGDEVIVPAYTYCATANVVLHCGATPVFVDSNPDDFNVSLKAIEKAITPKTKVIIPVDIAGFPCDYNEINNLVNLPNIKKLFSPRTENQQKLGRILVLSDSAHSLGAVYYGKKTGILADCSVFSFHAVKNLITAEGGAIVFNLPEPFDNNELYTFFSIYSLHGQNKDALEKFKIGNWKYDIIEAGYKCNMPDILAAIGLVEIERYENDTLKRRSEIFELYSQAFLKYAWAQLPIYKTPHKKSSYHLYLLRILNITEKQRNEIIQRIFSHNVSVNVHFQPVPSFTFYNKLGYNVANYPTAFDNYSRVITLPVYYDLTNENVNKVIDAVVKSVEA